MKTTHKKTITSVALFAALLVALPAYAQTLEDVGAATDISAGIDSNSAAGTMNAKNKAMDALKKIPGVQMDNKGKPAQAEGNLKVNAQVKAGVGSTTLKASLKADTKVKARGDQELDRRIKGLTSLKAKVANMKRITDAQKASIAAGIDNQIAILTQLKAKIDADADADTLKIDVKSITDSYRIYALILPQIEILAAADRIAFTADTLAALSLKLQANIATLKASGKTVTSLETSLADLNAKVADARVQVNASVAIVGSLTPDNGDKTKMASNTQALKDARAKVKIGNTDVVAARKDASTIVSAFKSSHIKTDIIATTTVSTQASTTITSTTTVNH